MINARWGKVFMITSSFIANDSVDQRPILFQEGRSVPVYEIKGNLYSHGYDRSNIPDIYFITVILVVATLAWFRVFYGKFLNSVWLSAFSYQGATKIYKDQSIIQRRFGNSLDLLYLINGSLFIYILSRYFGSGIFGIDDFSIIWFSFLVLFALTLLRILVMRTMGLIFERQELYKSFLYHFFIYHKVLGMVIVPFLILIPYSEGIIQRTLVFTGISFVIIIFLIRLFRSIIFMLKNVVLLFYLILYLCTLEILPILVVLKLLISLAQV